MVQRPEVLGDWNTMLIARTFQQHGNGAGLLVHISQSHAETAVPTCALAPIANSLPRAIQQGKDSFVSPGMGCIDELLGQRRINLSRKVPGHATGVPIVVTCRIEETPPTDWVDRVQRNVADSPAGKAGSVLVVEFTLAGQRFLALNGGTRFEYTPAISFQVDCADQPEVDRLWDALSEGGMTQRCGWLRDRYGISWQIVPRVLPELLGDPDPIKAQRVMQAMLQMVKLDIAGLRAAQAD